MASNLYKVNPFFIDLRKNKIGILGYREGVSQAIFLSYEHEVMILKVSGNYALIFHPDGVVWVELEDISGPLDIDQLLLNLPILTAEKKTT